MAWETNMRDIVQIAKEHTNTIIRRSLDLTKKPKETEDLDKLRVLMMLRKCANEYSWTPDACLLERSEYTPVFIYCNAIKGGNRYSVIENIHRKKDDDGLSITPYVFTKNRYEVWQTRDGVHSIPVAFASRATPNPPFSELPEHERGYICQYGQLTPMPARLKGRLYFIRSDMMKELDKEKQNGVLFRRRLVNILNPYRMQVPDPGYGHPMRSSTTGHTLTEEDAVMIQAWMYVGRRAHWDQFLDGPYGPELKVCTLYDSTVRHYRLYNGRPIFTSPNKRWMDNNNEPYYFFNAWGVNNNQ